MSRFVVTGGAGFIGSHLVDFLTARGNRVEVIDRLTGPDIQHTPHPGKVDGIFHLAAPVGPVGVLEWAGRLAREVIETSAIVAEWAQFSRCPLIDVSTSEVYGSGREDAEGDVCTFRPEVSARKEYAVGKLAAETMLLNQRHLDVRVVRPFNVAGPRQQPEGGFVLPRFILQALSNEPLTVYQPGTQQRAFAHVEDIVDGLWRAYLYGMPRGVYNLGNPDNLCSIETLAREVIEAVGLGSYVIVDPVRLHGPSFREAPDKVPNIGRAVRELLWEPKRSRAEVIADTVAWWRSVREPVTA